MPKARKRKKCPACGGTRKLVMKQFMGNDSYDDKPRYLLISDPCHVCTYTVRRVKAEYR